MRIFILMTSLVALSAWAFGLGLGPGHALAQGRGVEAGKEAEAWSAVGILRVRGGGWCSAALIDPSTVLTAAHCVYPEGGDRPFPPEAIQFNAGWRDGVTAAVRDVVRIVAHRDYDPKKPYTTPNIASDIAIVELDAPIPADVAASYPLLDRVRTGAPVSVVSFSGRRSDVASINESCSVNSRDKDILMLSCESYSGMSGAPIFTFVNDKPQIVALISGRRISFDGANNGIALAIRAPLDRVRLDAAATAAMPASGLPNWTRRAARKGNQAPVAVRRKISVGGGSGLSGLTGSGGGRKVVKPPKSSR